MSLQRRTSACVRAYVFLHRQVKGPSPPTSLYLSARSSNPLHPRTTLLSPAPVSPAPPQSGAIYSFKHLQLITRDNANQLWVAAAPDVCSLSRVAPPPPHSAGGGGGGGGQQPGRRSSLGGGMASGPGSGDPVVGWARGPAGQQQLELYGRKIDRLRGGG